jgi:hemolysin activation/secretion protein
MRFHPRHPLFSRLGGRRVTMAVIVLGSIAASLPVAAAPAPPLILAKGNNAAIPHFYVQEYRVEGAHHLPRAEVEKAVYRYLGPYRTAADVEQARAALERAYQENGYQTVAVQIPPQSQIKAGIVVLKVVEMPVGRLRVQGSRYFDPRLIKAEAPSLAEGSVINFRQVSRDIVGLNQSPDLRVTPAMRPGVDPETVDVDLNVKDSSPLHGSLELNNRYSSDTDPLRLNGNVSYGNLWQMDHTIGFGFQVAPQDISQVEVFSAYYSVPVPDMPWLTLMLQGTDQNSNVSTLGGAAVAGKGDVIGLRALISLPPQKDYYHSLSLGFDYKHFDQDLTVGGSTSPSPITYMPFSATYSGSWIGKGYSTVLDGGVTFHLRGMGSDPDEFENRRSGATGDFVYFRGDLSHTRDLPGDFQVFGKAQVQVADEPLLDSEEFSGGGLGTARGYLESEALGDNALFGSFELRSPSIGSLLGKSVNEWRFYLFSDDGWLTVNDATPEQTSSFTLASFGAGTHIRLNDHYNGSLDVGVPVIAGPNTPSYSALFTFRLWAEF